MRKFNLNFLSYFAVLTMVFFSACGDGPDPVNVSAEKLDCNYFNNGTSRTLTHDPDRKVDYIITCEAIVSVDLVIEPGVVIEFEDDAGLEIGREGSISALGTATAPIILTGVNKVKGAWKGVYCDSDDVKNELEYVTIEYGGGNEFNSNGNKANLIIWADSRMSIDHCTFSNSASYGVEMDYQNYNIPSFKNNTLTQNETAMYLQADEAHILDASNDFTGNINDYVIVGTVELNEGAQTWQAINVPYHFTATGFGNFREAIIPNNCDLTIAAGAVLEFESNTGIQVNDGGSLNAIGTADNQITFTGVDKAPGAWSSIEYRFTESVNNKIEYAIIEYAGSGDNDAAIYMWAEPKLAVNNCTFKDIEGCVFVDGTPNLAGVFDNPKFLESGNTYENITGGTLCP